MAGYGHVTETRPPASLQAPSRSLQTSVGYNFNHPGPEAHKSHVLPRRVYVPAMSVQNNGDAEDERTGFLPPQSAYYAHDYPQPETVTST